MKQYTIHNYILLLNEMRMFPCWLSPLNPAEPWDVVSAATLRRRTRSSACWASRMSIAITCEPCLLLPQTVCSARRSGRLATGSKETSAASNFSTISHGGLQWGPTQLTSGLQDSQTAHCYLLFSSLGGSYLDGLQRRDNVCYQNFLKELLRSVQRADRLSSMKPRISCYWRTSSPHVLFCCGACVTTSSTSSCCHFRPVSELSPHSSPILHVAVCEWCSHLFPPSLGTLQHQQTLIQNKNCHQQSVLVAKKTQHINSLFHALRS